MRAHWPRVTIRTSTARFGRGPTLRSGFENLRGYGLIGRMVVTTIPGFDGNDVVNATYKKLGAGNIPARRLVSRLAALRPPPRDRAHQIGVEALVGWFGSRPTNAASQQSRLR